MLKIIELTSQDKHNLKVWLDRQENIFSFFQDLQKSTLIVSHTIQQEIGGINDNLSRYLYRVDTEEKVERKDLHSELCKYDGMIGIKVSNKNSSNMKITLHGFNEFTHFINGGFIILPELAANYLLRENIQPVLIKRWLMNTTFSTFNPTIDLYQNQMWILLDNDAFLYSKLIANFQMVLQGIHDLTDHAANAKYAGWEKAMPIAADMNQKIKTYFHPHQKGNIPSHLICLAAGAILDELVQPPAYGSIGRITAIQALLSKLDKNKINPHTALSLKNFPTSIDHVIATAAQAKTQEDLSMIYSVVDHYYKDILNLTWCYKCDAYLAPDLQNKSISLDRLFDNDREPQFVRETFNFV